MKQKLIVILLPLLAAVTGALAQNTEEIRKKFPGEEAVVLNNSQQYKITLKNGEPYVESKDVQQLLYLAENPSTYMSRYGFSQSGFHQVTAYEAYTRTPDNKKIKVTEFKTSDNNSSSIFYDDVKETSFDFPALTTGATGNLEMSILHKDGRLLSPFYFSRYIPVINAELKISFPKDMSVKYLIKGNEKDRIKVIEDQRRNEITYTFSVKDMPADKRYPDAPDNAYYATHVIFYIEKYKGDNGEWVSYLANLDDLHRMNYSHIKDINKTTGPQLLHLVDSLTKGITAPEQKARVIYQWVQQHIKYVAFENGMEGFVPRDANLVCDRRFGDCKDMSSILTVMLNQAGVKAFYTWIGTRDIPYDYSEVHTPIVDNHMICTIQLGNEYVYLDGTDPSCVFGIPSGHIQGKQAMLAVDEKTYKILRVPVAGKDKSILTDSTQLVITDKGIKGDVSIDMSGYFSMDMHTALNYVTEKDREDYFKRLFRRGSNKFRLEKYEFPDLSNKNRLRTTGKFELQDYAKKVAGEWYINMNLFRFYEHEEIDFPKRKSPIELDHQFLKKYVTVLTIPEGYKVSYLPPSKSFHNDVWGFDMKYEEKNNQVILTQEFQNGYLLLTPDKFEAWNKVLEQLFPLYKETVSLSKK